MLGYSKKKYKVFIFTDTLAKRVQAKVQVETNLIPLDELTSQQWKQLKQLRGRLAVWYLRWRYGSPETYILLAFVEKILAHIEWVVPAYMLKSRSWILLDGI
jgi:hypothetical protein